MIESTYMNDEMFKKVNALAKKHIGKSIRKELSQFRYDQYATKYFEMKGNRLDTFMMYLSAPHNSYDVVWFFNRYNKFSISAYRVMKQIHKNATRTIVTTIISNHEVLSRFAERNNGILLGDALIFIKEGV